MRIAVGTLNPAKIEAVKRAATQLWPGAEVIAVEADSGVSDQPRSDEEAIRGALNRARASLGATGADLGLGLEGCTIDSPHGMFLTGWVAAVDRTGTQGLGNGGALLLPEAVARRVRDGEELGPVMDAFTGESNTKQKLGAVGFLTGGLVSRTEAFERSVLFACSKFHRPELYR